MVGACRLKRNDLNLEERTLRVDERFIEVAGRFEWGSTKTAGAERVVDLAALVVAPLAGHLLRFPPLRDTAEPNTEGLLFYGERKGVVRRHVFRGDWQRACERAKVDHVRPEWLSNNSFIPVCDPNGDAGTAPDDAANPNATTVDEVCPDVSQIELDLDPRFGPPAGDGVVTSTKDFESSGAEGANAGVAVPYTVKFAKRTTTGLYRFVCMLHPFMKGKVFVG